MTILDMLYGSQYAELEKKAYDVSKGRMYGNLLLSAVIIVYLFLIILGLNMISDDFAHDFTRLLRKTFGRTGGRTIGRIIAIPLLAAIYFIVSMLIGSKSRYEKYHEAYLKATKQEREKAMAKMLIIFFSGLGLLTVLAISSLFI